MIPVLRDGGRILETKRTARCQDASSEAHPGKPSSPQEGESGTGARILMCGEEPCHACTDARFLFQAEVYASRHGGQMPSITNLRSQIARRKRWVATLRSQAYRHPPLGQESVRTRVRRMPLAEERHRAATITHRPRAASPGKWWMNPSPVPGSWTCFSG